MTELYRFRATEQLLDKFHELEEQTIYFASPEELNDPMEGFRDIVWRGDRIVWTNLFRNFVFCLERFYSLVKIAGDSVKLDRTHIPIDGRWDEPLTSQSGKLFDDLWARAFHDAKLNTLIEKIASTTHKVRYHELVLYLRIAHTAILPRIQEIYVDRGFASESERPSPLPSPTVARFANSTFFEQRHQIDDDKDADILFSAAYQVMTGEDLARKYAWPTGPGHIFERNKQLLLLDFPPLYVDRLESLLWPDWYAACFTGSYHNSSSWAHYGDEHKGVCLIFDTEQSGHARTLALNQITGGSSNAREEGTREHRSLVRSAFYEVNYKESLEEVDFFRSIGRLPGPAIMSIWYSDESGNVSECSSHMDARGDMDSWREHYWDAFYRDIVAKTKDWSHEHEHRLILNGLLGELDKQQRTVTYEFDSLQGIIFGAKTSDEDKMKIIDVIERKCRERGRTDFKLFQAYYSPKHGEIRKFEIPLGFSVDEQV